MLFQVKFKFSSCHYKSKFNLVKTVKEEREAENLDDLYEILENEMDWDVSCVYNPEGIDSWFCTNRDYIEIRDSQDKVLYKDEDEDLGPHPIVQSLRKSKNL